jgi:peptidyl-prolyl cis-trans isomerase D
VVLSPEELAKSITVPEERQREEYEARKDQLAVPEKRHIRQFVLSDPSTAATAAERVKTEPFDTVAKDLGGGDPIDLGSVTRDSLPPELAEAAFKPTAPGVLGPVETALGLHILSIEAIEAGGVPAFEQVREQLRNDIAVDQAMSEIGELANDLEDALAGGATLEQAASQLNLQAQKIGAVDASGKAPDGTEVAPVAANQTLRAIAFAAEEGQTTDLTELEDGSYAIMHVDGIQAAAPRPLEEARNDVVAAWLREEEAKALAAKAEAAAERIRGGEPIETIANELGLAVKTSSSFTREAGDPAAAVDRRLSATLFALKGGEVATAAAEGGHVIAQLVEVKSPEPLAGDAATVLESELEQSLQSDLQAQYVRALQREIPVSVNQPVLDSLFE